MDPPRPPTPFNPPDPKAPAEDVAALLPLPADAAAPPTTAAFSRNFFVTDDEANFFGAAVVGVDARGVVVVLAPTAAVLVELLIPGTFALVNVGVDGPEADPVETEELVVEIAFNAASDCGGGAVDDEVAVADDPLDSPTAPPPAEAGVASETSTDDNGCSFVEEEGVDVTVADDGSEPVPKLEWDA